MSFGKIISFLAAVVMIVSCDTASNIDAPEKDYFIKHIGAGGDQFGIDLVTSADGSIYVLGNTTTFTEKTNYYVVKLNSEGIVEWDKSIGTTEDEDAVDIELMSDGNLAIVGNTLANGEQDFLVYLLNASDGSEIAKTTSGITGQTDHASSITQTSDGFIVTGYSDNAQAHKESFYFRFTPSLTTYSPSWSNKVDLKDATSTGFDLALVKLFEVRPNFFYAFGYTNRPIQGQTGAPDFNYFMFAVGANGGTINPLYVPNPINNERLTSVAQVPVQSGSGYLLTGYTVNPTSGLQDIYMVQVKTSLETIASDNINDLVLVPPQTITSGLSPQKSTKAIGLPSAFAGYVILGSENTEGNDNIYLSKVVPKLVGASFTFADAWTERPSFVIGGVGNDIPGALAETADGKILMVGTMVVGKVTDQKKIVLMKMNAQGMLNP